MKNALRVSAVLVGLVALAGCGGGGSSGPADTAVLSGTLTETGAARIAARTVADDAGSAYYVEAVDETGTTQDAAQGLRPGDSFELFVPAGHVYVVVVGDDVGPIGGMVYDPASGRADFEIPEGATHIALGTIEVDPATRRVRARDNGDPLEPPEGMGPPTDTDGDRIPDFADRDDDNDGIEDDMDRMAGQDMAMEHEDDGVREPDEADDDGLGNAAGPMVGVDMSLDHDNDGIRDPDDPDDDNDGIPDVEDVDPVTGDDMSRDRDNDGWDDDRAMGQAGDPAEGARLYGENGCASCHGPDGAGGEEPIRYESAGDIAEALMGEDQDEGMPAFPGLVAHAADLAAFLSTDPADVPEPPATPDPGTTDPAAGGGTTPDPGTPPSGGSGTPAPGTGGSGTPGTPGSGVPTPAVDGQAVYQASCAGCHRVGTFDTAGFAPDLSGKGAMVPMKFAGGSHNGQTLTPEEMTALSDFLNTH